MFIAGFTSSAMSNVLSMPPSLAAFVVLNILGWLIQMRAWNPFWIAAACELPLLSRGCIIFIHFESKVEFVNIVCCIILLTVKVYYTTCYTPSIVVIIRICHTGYRSQVSGPGCCNGDGRICLSCVMAQACPSCQGHNSCRCRNRNY